jgi:ribosomal protein S18 acetylase RimI-like enzyme
MQAQLVDYRPEWQPHFERLNKAWLEEYFTVEPIDEWVLGHPEEAILRDGGRILFVEDGDTGAIVGTVALRWLEPEVLELTKMAVDRAWRGHGLGKMLCQAAIRRAGELGAHKLILYSQTGLAAAIAIYRRLGFTEIPLEPGTYARADIKMELLLTGPSRRIEFEGSQAEPSY